MLLKTQVSDARLASGLAWSEFNASGAEAKTPAFPNCMLNLCDRATRKESTTVRQLEPLSHFEDFLELRQVLGSFGRHQDNIFESHATEARVIESGFDGYDLSGSEEILRRGVDSRWFVDFKPQPMAGSVKKPLHFPVPAPGLEPLLFEELFDDLVNLHSWASVAQVSEGQILGSRQGRVDSSNRLAGPPLYHGPAYVGEVSRLL